MDTSFEASYDLSFEDFLAADALVLNHCKKAGRTARIFRVYIPILGAACFFYAAYSVLVQHQPVPIYVAGLAIAGLYIAVVGPFLRKRQLRKAWNTILPSGSTSAPMTFAFNSVQVSMINRGKSEYTHLWSSVQATAESDDMYVIFISKLNYFYVPKRILSNDALSQLHSRTRGIGADFKC